MQKNTTLESEKKIFLAIPETCYQTSSLFFIPNIKLCFYRIKPTYQCNIIPQKKPILYAPSFLALWALHYTVENPHLFSALLCHGKQWYSPLALIWLKLRLKNDRYLMGSDVPSPMIIKALHQHVAVSNYSTLPIGTWLQLIKNYETNYNNLSIPLLWLDNYKNNTDIHKVILKF
ncbi:hypothetical protein V4P56_03835 [Bartonella sp. B35(2025)]